MVLTAFTSWTQDFGFQLGAVFNFGTHINAVGFNSNLYYTNRFVQLNLSTQSKLNFTNYGGRKYFAENRFASGIILLAGKKDNIPDFEFDALLHNTHYNYAIGYNYIWYSDDIGTSQLSGGWSLGLKKFSILFENDVFGGQARDRFRSGVLELSYRNQNVKYFTNMYIWTGETKKSVWNKTPMPNCPNGFRSLENLPYGKTSHGIVSVGVRGVFSKYEIQNISQVVGTKIGLDSEQIRHFLQNRLSHDLIFMPKTYKRNTPHYPRLNSEGKPSFKKEERRKDKIYLQFSLNEGWWN
jgi:hypothetical protein